MLKITDNVTASGLNGPQCVQTPAEDISVWSCIFYTVMVFAAGQLGGHRNVSMIGFKWFITSITVFITYIITHVYLLDHITVSKLHQCPYCSWRRVEFAHCILVNHLPVPAGVWVERRTFKLQYTQLINHLLVPASVWVERRPFKLQFTQHVNHLPVPAGDWVERRPFKLQYTPQTYAHDFLISQNNRQLVS